MATWIKWKIQKDFKEVTGHITIYDKDHEVLNWRAFYSKDGCKKIFDAWTKHYGEQAEYFQIYLRPRRYYNESVTPDKKEEIIRPKSVYQNLPIYNYDK